MYFIRYNDSHMRQNTRGKLLDAALDVFAEHGYRSATIQQIVSHAGTNIAAVNYHFRDKANFYAEVVLYGLEKSGLGQAIFMADSGTPEDQLNAFVRWFLRRTLGFDQECLIDQIHMQEMLQPSPVLDKIVEKLVRPSHKKLRQIVSALLPVDASEETVRFHCFSVIGQCNIYKLGKPIITRLYPDLILDEHKAKQLARHIANVCLAGIKAEHERNNPL